MKTYRVVLPLEIEGRVYEYGSTIELDMEEAKYFAHALIVVKEGDDGGNS